MSQPRTITLVFITAFLYSCTDPKPIEFRFIQNTYSNKKTEIVDHVLLELLGSNYCYESFQDYLDR